MINTKFEAYKVNREIKRSGSSYEFSRSLENEFGEPETGVDPQDIGTLKALYHEENSNIQFQNGENVITRTKKIPMLLCLYDSWTSLGLKVGDFTFINGKKFVVTGCVNVQEWSIIADVSLEVFDGGRKD